MSAWRSNDAEAFVKHGAVQEVARFMRDGFPCLCSIDEASEFIEQCLASSRPDADIFAIRYEGVAIGSIGLFGQAGVHSHCAELAYWLGVQHWGKGVMKAAISSIVPYGTKRHGYLRIFALPYVSNDRSCNLLRSCGFHHEGTLRMSERKADEYIDQEVYAVTQQGAHPGAIGAG